MYALVSSFFYVAVAEIGSYFSIIRVIAAGHQKLGHIAAALGLKSTGLSRYLRTLMDLDILERQVPITEDNPEKSKRGLYRLKDNFVRFWFLFVYPNKNMLETDHFTSKDVMLLFRKRKQF